MVVLTVPEGDVDVAARNRGYPRLEAEGVADGDLMAEPPFLGPDDEVDLSSASRVSGSVGAGGGDLIDAARREDGDR